MSEEVPGDDPTLHVGAAAPVEPDTGTDDREWTLVRLSNSDAWCISAGEVEARPEGMVDVASGIIVVESVPVVPRSRLAAVRVGEPDTGTERAMRRVQQEDPDGCGVAVLAMLTGQSYAAVDAEWPLRLTKHWKDSDVKPHMMMAYLWKRGYHLLVVRDRRYHDALKDWPSIQPFAPMHYAMVDSPTQPTGHWIAIDGHGAVLDPFDGSRKTLDCYEKMHEVVGVWPPVRVGEEPVDEGRLREALRDAVAHLRKAVQWVSGDNKVMIGNAVARGEDVLRRPAAPVDEGRAACKYPDHRHLPVSSRQEGS